MKTIKTGFSKGVYARQYKWIRGRLYYKSIIRKKWCKLPKRQKMKTIIYRCPDCLKMFKVEIKNKKYIISRCKPQEYKEKLRIRFLRKNEYKNH